jgi:hypothetical protein
MNRHKHLKAFKEAIVRCKLIRKDLEKINSNIESWNYRQQRDFAETAYIQTLEEIIDRGKKYLSLNPEADESIRVAIDIEKYSNILEALS